MWSWCSDLLGRVWQHLHPDWTEQAEEGAVPVNAETDPGPHPLPDILPAPHRRVRLGEKTPVQFVTLSVARSRLSGY